MSERWSVTILNDWTNGNCFVFANVSCDWLRGQWATGEITFLGLGVSVTRWGRYQVPVESLGREHGA